MKAVFTLLFALTCLPLAAQDLKKQPAPGDSKRELQVFEVKDLIQPKDPDLEAPDENMGAKEKAALEEKRRVQTKKNLEALAGFIRVFIEPSLEPGEEVKSLGNQSLVVLGQPTQLAWVHRFLTMNRRKDPHFLQIETRLMHFSEASYARLLKPILKQATDTTGKKTGPVHALLKAGKKTDEFLAALDKAKASVVAPATLLCYPLQRVTLSVTNDIAYVKDFQFTRTVSPPALIADPVIDVLKDGVMWEGTGGFVTADKIGISFKLTVAEVHRPIKVVNIPKEKLPVEVRGGPPLKISLPETTTTALTAKAEIPAGGYGIFSMGRRHKQYWIVTIKAAEIAVK